MFLLGSMPFYAGVKIEENAIVTVCNSVTKSVQSDMIIVGDSYKLIGSSSEFWMCVFENFLF